MPILSHLRITFMTIKSPFLPFLLERWEVMVKGRLEENAPLKKWNKKGSEWKRIDSILLSKMGRKVTRDIRRVPNGIILGFTLKDGVRRGKKWRKMKNSYKILEGQGAKEYEYLHLFLTNCFLISSCDMQAPP